MEANAKALASAKGEVAGQSAFPGFDGRILQGQVESIYFNLLILLFMKCLLLTILKFKFDFASLPQVAENLYVSSQENAEHKVLKQFVLNVHSCYMAALEFGKTPCEKLAATKLAEESTVTWLKTLLHRQCSRLAKNLSTEEKGCEEVLVKGLSELKPLPLLRRRKKVQRGFVQLQFKVGDKGRKPQEASDGFGGRFGHGG